MTTIAVVRKGDTACIVADTLTKHGNRYATAEYVFPHDKILKVDDTYFALVGHVVTHQVLKSYWSNPKRRRSFRDVDDIFETLRALHAVLKEEYFLNPVENEKDAYESMQFDALLCNRHGIFSASFDRLAQEYYRFHALGTGEEFAMGAMFATYDRLETAEEIARAGIEAAATFDDSTGLPMTIHKVKLD